MSSLITNRDFIFVGQQPWDVAIGSNCKNIAEEVAKHNKVLYVNIPLDRNTIWRNSEEEADFIEKRQNVLKRRSHPLEKINENLWVLTPRTILESINILPVGNFFDYLNEINNKRLAEEIQKSINKLALKDFILFNDGDMFRSFYLPELIEPSTFVYYSRDNLMATSYYKKHGPSIEPKLIARADVIVANSPYLKEYCAQYNTNAHYVGQGCDLSIFNPNQNYSEPNDLANIKTPRIGYIGALLELRLDIKLLEELTAETPDWQWIFVGPEDDAFKESSLHNLTNVHFLGAKPPERLAAYLNAFDVAINPQTINEMTIGNYPRKIDEYLAMGKPTVATRTQAMSIFKEHTFLAEGKEEYLKAIKSALKANSQAEQKERIDFANTHTWENSVSLIYKAIKQTIHQK